MKKLKITARDVKFFLLGAATLFALEVVFNWEAHKQAFKDGIASGYENYDKD